MRAVECTGEDRGHEPIRPRKGCDRFKGAARALQVRSAGIAGQYVQLEQRDRRYRVFDQGLDRLGQPAERVGPGGVEAAAEGWVALRRLDVGREVERCGPPPGARPGPV